MDEAPEQKVWRIDRRKLEHYGMEQSLGALVGGSVLVPVEGSCHPFDIKSLPCGVCSFNGSWYIADSDDLSLVEGPFSTKNDAVLALGWVLKTLGKDVMVVPGKG